MKRQLSAQGATETTGVTHGRRRSVASLVLALIASLLVGLAPGPAQGDGYGPAGVGGARITVSPDGYDTPASPYDPGKDSLKGSQDNAAQVTGMGLKGSDTAYIFQCWAGTVDLYSRQCHPLAQTTTDAEGNFEPTDVQLNESVPRIPIPLLEGSSTCAGFEYENVQCSVVAATFGPDIAGNAVTSRAEHLICFRGSHPYQQPGHPGNDGWSCDPQPDVPVANDDYYSTRTDVPLSVPAPGVLGNDTDRQIAECLEISPHTVRSHLRNVFAKLGLPTRVDLVREVQSW